MCVSVCEYECKCVSMQCMRVHVRVNEFVFMCLCVCVCTRMSVHLVEALLAVSKNYNMFYK